MATAPSQPAASPVPGPVPPPDLQAVPMVALNYGVRRRLGLYLNPRAAAAADWTALAEALGCSFLEIRRLERLPDPTAALLEEWPGRCPGGATVGQLLAVLRRLGRDDVLTDLAGSVGEALGMGSAGSPGNRMKSRGILSLMPGREGMLFLYRSLLFVLVLPLRGDL